MARTARSIGYVASKKLTMQREVEFGLAYVFEPKQRRTAVTDVIVLGLLPA